MKGRIKRKRKKQMHIEGLERGNAYLLESMKRLMEKLRTAQTGLEQVQAMYDAYLTAAIDKCGGEMIVIPERVAELAEKYTIRTRAEENGDIVIAVVEKEQA